jgi:hypothetical protein
VRRAGRYKDGSGERAKERSSQEIEVTQTQFLFYGGDNPTETERLKSEADHVHRALFGTDAPEEVKRQYEAALRILPLDSMPNHDLIRLAEEGADLEAIEIALRRKNPSNALTQRFQVMCYLAEVRPAYFDRFVNRRRSFFTGVLSLGWFSLRSAYKAMKGSYLLRRHGSS